MRRSKYSESQQRAAVQSELDGALAEDVCRQYGISPATFYRWKRRYSGSGQTAVALINELEAQMVRLTALIDRQQRDVASLRAIVAGKLQTAHEKRVAVRIVMRARDISERHACAFLAVSRAMLRYRKRDRNRE
jgi:putative transposase